jgi:hypothetical protein
MAVIWLIGNCVYDKVRAAGRDRMVDIVTMDVDIQTLQGLFEELGFAVVVSKDA